MNAFREVGNLLLKMLPVSGGFRLKRGILALMGVEVHEGVSVNGHTMFYGRGHIRIGKNTWVGPGCRFYATAGTTIELGENCDIAPEVAFVTGTHDIGPRDRRAGRGHSESIEVGRGCWLGVRTTVLGGASIGDGTVVAACTLVRSSVPEDSFVAGIPGVLKRSLADAPSTHSVPLPRAPDLQKDSR